MKIGKVDIGEFIDSVPVLRLFAKNLALSGGIAFIVQDFLIPLYSNFILPIVVGLMMVAIISLIYWNFSKRTGKKFDHSTFQLSIVLVILSIVITSLSSVSKAFSSGADTNRGILASNVKFIADIQGETNVYKEDIASLGIDISRLQSDLSNLSAQISAQISNEGSLSNEDFLNKISSLIDEKKLDNSMSDSDLVEDLNDNEEAKEIKNLKRDLEIATELLKQVTLTSIKVQEKESNNILASQLESSVLTLAQSDIDGVGEQIKAVLGFAQQLRNQPTTGRMTINIMKLNNNLYLQDGDKLMLPKRPSHVSVVGAVQRTTVASYNQNKTYKDYIFSAGGLTKMADIRKSYVLLPNGESRLLENKTIIPAGSVVVVPPKIDKLSVLGLTDIISRVLGNIATSILAINNVN